MFLSFGHFKQQEGSKDCQVDFVAAEYQRSKEL